MCRKKWFVLTAVLIFLAACSQGSKPETPTEAVEVVAPTTAPTEVPPTVVPTEVALELTEAAPLTEQPTETIFEWPAPFKPEPAFTRSEVTAGEQATFDLLNTTNYPPNDPIALAIAYGVATEPEPPPTEPPVLSEGMTQSFWIHNDDSLKWSQIEARLLKITEHAYFWFDTTREPDPAAVERAAAAFEGFYQAVRDIYGEEPAPGIDGDPRIYIVHASALALCDVDEETAHQCLLLGYFSSTDSKPVEVDEHSNEHEMFVMNIDRAIGGERYISTLVHEFRHMIEDNYDRHDDDWEVEGTAVMAQMIVDDTASLQVRANGFVENTDIQMNAWAQGNFNAHYGKGYVLSRYILDRFGLEFYSAWVQHPDRAFFAIDAVLDDFGYDFSALDMWRDFTAAVALIGKKGAPAEFAFSESFEAQESGKISITRFPSEINDTVNQFGFDIYALFNTEPVELTFTGSTKTAVFNNVVPASGQYMWMTGRSNQSDFSLTREVDLTGVDSATLNYEVRYSIEKDWDFAYVLLSTDGGVTWQPQVAENMAGESDRDDPGDFALANRFYTGRARAWLSESIDLTPYAGQVVLVRFQYITDPIYTAPGLALDNISVPEIGFYDDVENGENGWDARGFLRVTASIPQQFFISLVTYKDGQPVIQRVEVAPDNTAVIDVPGGTSDTRPLLIITATSPITLTPAEYILTAGE